MTVDNITNYIYSLQGGHTLLLLIVLLIVVISEIVLRVFKSKRKREFRATRPNHSEVSEIEMESFDYHRDIQRFVVARFLVLSLALFALVSLENKQTTVFAFTFATIVLIFKEPIVSLFSYVYILSGYKTGDTISIDGALGQIVSVYPLYVKIAGHDDIGEYNGKLYQLPNYIFLQKTIERRQLRNHDHRRITANLVYNREVWVDDFSLWLCKLKGFLDSHLPERSWAEVGNFKSYAGVKYKITFDYTDKGHIMTVVSFISSFDPMLDRKQAVFEFVESMPKKEKNRD
jgi:hypothetical protein